MTYDITATVRNMSAEDRKDEIQYMIYWMRTGARYDMIDNNITGLSVNISTIECLAAWADEDDRKALTTATFDLGAALSRHNATMARSEAKKDVRNFSTRMLRVSDTLRNNSDAARNDFSGLFDNVK